MCALIDISNQMLQVCRVQLMERGDGQICPAQEAGRIIVMVPVDQASGEDPVETQPAVSLALNR